MCDEDQRLAATIKCRIVSSPSFEAKSSEHVICLVGIASRFSSSNQQHVNVPSAASICTSSQCRQTVATAERAMPAKSPACNNDKLFVFYLRILNHAK